MSLLYCPPDSGQGHERRMSAAGLSAHGVRHGGVVDDEEDTERLRVLYNKAIETVQNADEAMLMDENRHHSRLKVGPILYSDCLLAFIVAIVTSSARHFALIVSSTDTSLVRVHVW